MLSKIIISPDILASGRPMCTILNFLNYSERLEMQLLNRKMYKKIVPAIFDKITKLSETLILENNSSGIYIAKCFCFKN